MENEEIKQIKSIVNSVFMVNIDVETRRRSHVDARRAYSKIMRERGYSFEKIGKTLEKDHATIIHYLRNIDYIFAYDLVFLEKYAKCKNMMLVSPDGIDQDIPEKVYVQRIKDLEGQVTELVLQLNKLNGKLSKYNRIKSIIKLINDRVVDEEIELVESKIRTLLNGLR
jgi:hypothetical protein